MENKIPVFTVRYTASARLRLTVDSNGKLVLYCPKRYPKSKYMDFVEKNAERLLKDHEKVQNRSVDMLFGNSDGSPSLPYLGKRYPVARAECQTAYFDGSTFVFPKAYSRAEVVQAYREILRAGSKQLLPQLCKSIATVSGLTYNKVYVKNICSRWGSCSSSKNLNFSLALIACPEEFVRYVVSHELSHTVHLDHSKDFYEALEQISPIPLSEAKRLSREYAYVIRAVCRE